MFAISLSKENKLWPKCIIMRKHYIGLEIPKFLKNKFWGFTYLGFKGFFNVLIYEDRTQNDDPEIHEECLIYDTPFPLSHLL